MYRQLTSIAAALICAGLLACTGCGPKRPETAAVSGRVAFQGQPVVEGTIVFHPEHGRPAMGTIGSDGSYNLRTFEDNDGAQLGKHRVTIEARRITTPFAPGDATHEAVPLGPPKVEWLVPEKYSRLETTPLTAEVKPGRNKIDFDLP